MNPEVRAHPPVADVNYRRAVSLEGGSLEHGLVGVNVHLAQRRLRVQPLRILLIAVENERSSDKALVNQRFGILHTGAVAKGEAQFCFEALAARERRGAQRAVEVVGHRLLAQDLLA